MPPHKQILQSSHLIAVPCLYQRSRNRRSSFKITILNGLLFLIFITTLVFNILFLVDQRTREQSHSLNDDEDNIYHNKHIKVSRDSTAKRDDIIKKVNKGRMVTFEVKSGKESVYVSLDGLKLYENIVQDGSARGIHVIVINQFTGVIMAKQIFDTYAPGEDESLILFLNKLQDGRILIFTTMDEASQSFTKSAKNAIQILGSKNVTNLGWRDSWIFISKKRKKWLAETLQIKAENEEWSPTILLHATVELETMENHCKWGSDEVSIRRQQFCMKYEGYGSVCNCLNPSSIELKGPILIGSRVENVPIAVIAANRPFYLFRMLRRLLTTPGIDPKMVTVYIDGYYDEPSAVAALFKVASVEHAPICSGSCRISQHYKRALHGTFEKYSSASYMIILEEDLDVSEDIMDFFSQLLPVLETDESVYCISAWNDQGYQHSCNDPSMLYRVETMPGLGWVLKKKLFKEELEPQWPGSDKYWDWDMWMRTSLIRKGRECIIPDVSRTYHFGSKGLHIHPQFQQDYFKKHVLNTKTGLKFDTSLITKDGYEKHMENILREAVVLNHSKDACDVDAFIPPTKGKTYVMYIKQKKKYDYETWISLAGCYKLWDLDVRGFHKQMWRLWLKSNRIIIVGTSSVYITFKPSDVVPIFIPKKNHQVE